MTFVLNASIRVRLPHPARSSIRPTGIPQTTVVARAGRKGHRWPANGTCGNYRCAVVLLWWWSFAVDADQSPRPVPGPGHDHGRAAAAGGPQAAEQPVDIAGQAAAPDVNRADVQLTQLGGKLFLVPRPGVDDPQPPPERGPQRGAG